MRIITDKIPQELRDRKQWVLWRMEDRNGKQTKLPFQVDGTMAKSDTPATWNTFEAVWQVFQAGGYSGIGYVFAADDPYYGIDLDGCRNPETQLCEPWAKEILLEFGTYAEVSPSGTGVKLFVRGEPPVSGKKKVLAHLPHVGDKQPAIECYSQLRYFAVTGQRVGNFVAIVENPQAVKMVRDTYFADAPAGAAPKMDWRSAPAVMDRARKYIAHLPPAIAGQSGHNATFHAACVLVKGFGLSEAEALILMGEYNQTCQPAWSEKELLHKVRQAAKQPGPDGYLRDSAPERWGQISVPTYQEPAPTSEPRTTTIVKAAKSYLDSIRDGKTKLLGTSIPDLDYALGGGLEAGEMVIFAARPSHGKSLVGLQACHYWTEAGLPCLIVSEEMSARMLGKRTLQFLSKYPQESWEERIVDLEAEVAEYDRWHKPCVIVEGCGRAVIAAEMIEKHVRESGIRCAVVDYAQLLRGAGKSRYEQITDVSIILRQVATSMKIVLLVLCQLNRGIEGRTGDYSPVMSDLKDSGQLEQDADVIVFQCWPYRLNNAEPIGKYQFFVAKNRNRAINQHQVICWFRPDRQMVQDAPLEAPVPQEQYRAP